MRIGLRDSRDRFFPFPGGRALIGSSSRCEIVLDDSKTAGEHARIRVGDVGIEINDLGTEHGTFVNGYRINKHFLSPGDMVRFGGPALTVILSGNPKDPTWTQCRRCGAEYDPAQTRKHVAPAMQQIAGPLCPDCAQKATGRHPSPAWEYTDPSKQQASTGEREADTLMMEDGGAFKIPGYEPLGVLGRGGQGTVYKMQHADHGVVAVKVVRPEQGTRTKARFRREALALSRLQHPHLARLLETHEVDDAIVIVMEYVDGPSLEDILREQGVVPVKRAFAIARQVAEGVAFATAQGIVNRDIKPSNVLVGPNDHSKLTDFGLAAFQEDEGGTRMTRLTQEGHWVGTPQYMSPEQVEGKTAVPKTDVHGIGVTFYEAITGVPPFPARTATELFRRILREPVNLGPLKARAGEEARALFERLLAKKLEDRPEPTELVGLIDQVLAKL